MSPSDLRHARSHTHSHSGTQAHAHTQFFGISYHLLKKKTDLNTNKMYVLVYSYTKKLNLPGHSLL